MSVISTSLSKWFSERPNWLQVAANQLLNKGKLEDKDISELAILCQEEADGKQDESSCSFPPSAFSYELTGTLRLCSISEVEGVNALAPQKPLKFGKSNISVVYGENGSGKSGYVRLLKHICGARIIGSLHNNVYKPDSSVQKAIISFEKDGVVNNYNWFGQGISDDLSSVDIFDTSFGRVFVRSEDEVSYEPPVLSFLSSLIEVSEKVTNSLDTEANQLQSRKPNMPVSGQQNDEGVWYENISYKTTQQDIDKHCSFEKKNEKEIQNLQERLSEQTPAERAKQFVKQIQHLEFLVKDAQKYLEQLSDANCRRIILARKNATLKKTAADAAAEKVFSGSHLEGIGSDVWKELWNAARKFSVSLAYKEYDYPNVSPDSRCVLCHQKLSSEAQGRMISFENFVMGDMQQAVTDAVQEYKNAVQTIGEIPIPESLITRVDATSIVQDEFKSQVVSFFTELKVRKEHLLRDNSEELMLPPIQSPDWIKEAISQSKSLSESAAKYSEDAVNDNTDELTNKLSILQTKRWLSEHQIEIEEEVYRLKLLNRIKIARKATNTSSLSKKKGELASLLITDALAQRFNSELKVLCSSRVKVEIVKSRVSKGHVLHKLQLSNASQSFLHDVLSEGENRIVSIAAFLADVTGRDYSAPFIFDDPISSLDQTYEESVVQRLCALSTNRQVIIFTHRLSLLGLIQEYAKKMNKEFEIVCIRKESWGTGEPGDTPLIAKKPDKALNKLINDRLPRARKLLKEYGREEYDPVAKGLCSDFRIILERMIECELLADVVQRFRRAIKTMGKLEHLAKISKTDCFYFDEMMTKYSRYEHSQPSEAPVSLPDPDELQTDFSNLQQWQSEFKKRTIVPV